MENRIILDGELVEGDSVSLGVTGRAFAYGYGVFETIKFVGGVACYFREHVDRLAKAVAGAGLDLVVDCELLKRQAECLFEANGVSEGVFKIAVFENVEKVRVVLFVRTVGVTEDVEPIRLKLSPSIVASQAFTSRHKTLNYMEVMRDLKLAREQGFGECVYRNEHGCITECSVSNLFFVSEGVVKTPDLDCGLLDGIVRAQLIEILDTMGVSFEEGHFTVEDLLAADEVFATNSGVGVRAVVGFDAGEGRVASYAPSLSERLRLEFVEREQGDLGKA